MSKGVEIEVKHNEESKILSGSLGIAVTATETSDSAYELSMSIAGKASPLCIASVLNKLVQNVVRSMRGELSDSDKRDLEISTLVIIRDGINNRINEIRKEKNGGNNNE